MKIEFAGRYQWHGIFLDPDDGHEIEFVTFADSFNEAAINAKDMPGEVVYIERGDDVSGLDLDDVAPEVAEFINDNKKTLN